MLAYTKLKKLITKKTLKKSIEIECLSTERTEHKIRMKYSIK